MNFKLFLRIDIKWLKHLPMNKSMTLYNSGLIGLINQEIILLKKFAKEK